MDHRDRNDQSYQWRPTTPVGIRILGIAIVVVNLVFLVVALTAAEGDWLIIVPIAAMIAAGVLGLLLARSYMYLSIDPGMIHVGLWPFSKRTIRFAQLKVYTLVPHVRPSAFGGTGVRKTSGQQIAYLWEAGPGLELQKTDGETLTIVFDEARHASSVLDSLLAPHQRADEERRDCQTD